MRKKKLGRKRKPGGARIVKTTRWSPDEWRLIVWKAQQVKVTPSEYVRCKTLDTPPPWKRQENRAA